jgi:D-xylose transport system permease protein
MSRKRKLARGDNSSGNQSTSTENGASSVLLGSGNKRVYTLIAAIAVMWFISAMLSDGIFVTPRNITNLLRQASVTGILAVGTTMVLITGGLDLSVGSNLALSGIIAGILMRDVGLAPLPAAIITLLAGASVGLWNGFWIAKMGIPAFAATLSSMFVIRGLAYAVSKGCSISPIPASFCTLGKGYVGPTESIVLLVVLLVCAIIALWTGREKRIEAGLNVPPASNTLIACVLLAIGVAVCAVFAWLHRGIPLPVLVFLGYAGIGSFMLNKTKFGRHLFAVGGNSTAALFAGVNPTAIQMSAYVISGFTAALAGMVLTARLANAVPTAAPLAAFDAIASVLIGGTSIVDGTGTILGSVLGTLVIGTIDNSMSLLGILVTYQYIVKGGIILLAVYADIRRKRHAIAKD